MNKLQKIGIMAICLFALNANAFSLTGLLDAANAKLDAINKSLEQKNQASKSPEQNLVAKQQEPTSFKSLAEEKAYREQQALLIQQKEEQDKKDLLEKYTRLGKEYQVKQDIFCEKNFVKHTDTEAMIDEKYQKRSELFNKAIREYPTLQNEFQELDSHYEQLRNLEKIRYREPNNCDKTIFSFDVVNFDVSECYESNQRRWNRDCIKSYFNQYEAYLKYQFETYGSRENEQWKYMGVYDESEIIEFKKLGITLPEMQKWRYIGVKANEVTQFIKLQVKLEDIKKWNDANIETERIVKLVNLNIKIEDLNQLNCLKNPDSEQKCSIGDIIEWKENGFDLAEFDPWYNLKDSGGIRNSIKWKQKGYSLDITKEWFNNDINQIEIANIASKYGINSPKDAKKWKDVGIDIKRIYLFEEWMALGVNTPEKVQGWIKIFPEILSENDQKHYAGFQNVKRSIQEGYKTPEAYKAKQANELKERAKVKKVCDDWKAKIKKEVYSLGIGDKIVSENGAAYTIYNVYPNTFLVQNILGRPMHLQKSTVTPYGATSSAPSPYCYK